MSAGAIRFTAYCQNAQAAAIAAARITRRLFRNSHDSTTRVRALDAYEEEYTASCTVVPDIRDQVLLSVSILIRFDNAARPVFAKRLYFSI